MARDSAHPTIPAPRGPRSRRAASPPRLAESDRSGRLREERLEVVVERLCQDYPRVSLPEVIELVRTCRQQIDATAPPATVAELVERLARQRLNSLG